MLLGRQVFVTRCTIMEHSMRDRSEEDIMELVIHTKTIVRAIIIAVLLLTLAGLAARFALYMLGDEPFTRPLRLFDVGEERSIPTWFESMQFMLCSVLLAVVAVAKRQRSERYTLHWGVLSIIFLYLVSRRSGHDTRDDGRTTPTLAALHHGLHPRRRYLILLGGTRCLVRPCRRACIL